MNPCCASGGGGILRLGLTRGWAPVVGLCLAAGLALRADPARAQTLERSLTVGGLARTYRLHVPPNRMTNQTAALILVFHGRGGSGAEMEQITGFNDLADRAGFVVAYPDGVGKTWND